MSGDKPCPFCGNSIIQTNVDDGFHWLSCPKCSASGPTEFLRSDEGSPGWNTRPELDAQRLRADTAEAELADMQHWRDLALQFDRHRMAALGHLRAVVRCSDRDLLTGAEEFLKSPPLSAHDVVAKLAAAEQRNAELRELLRLMTNDYARCLEAGHDRITFLGGDCDSVSKMLADNTNYAKACAALNPNPEAESHG